MAVSSQRQAQLPQGTFGWPYAGFLFHSAAKVVSRSKRRASCHSFAAAFFDIYANLSSSVVLPDQTGEGA
jgi:hypothetical protein